MLKRLVLFCSFFISGSSLSNIIHITPGAFGNLFDIHVKIGNSQITCARLRESLQKIGYSIQQGESFRHLKNPAYIIFFDLSGSIQELQRYPKEKRVLFLWEPPESPGAFRYSKEFHQLFDKIFTWDDTLVDNKTYFKFHYPQPTLQMIESRIEVTRKKLCSFFGCNKQKNHPNQLYSERMYVIDFFEKNQLDEFDFYGIGWDEKRYRNFKGYISNKIGCLSRYKFNICYENTKDLPGYVTEKIFDCFVAGCIPIYWGASNITDYVPKDCFIDRRDFSSFDELYTYIKNMTDKEYEQYICNIKNYLKSDHAQRFSSGHFITTFITVLHLQ